MLEIEVFLDFICPWCLIGTRHLRAALARLAELRPEITRRLVWRSVQLLPDTPLAGESYQAFYLARRGNTEAVKARRELLRQVGRPTGIAFAFEDISLLANTAAAHQLLAYACAHETETKQAALVDRILTAYFVGCENIGDRDVLTRLGLACGLCADGMSEHFPATGNSAGPGAGSLAFENHAVGGVPYLSFNGRYALSGAYPVDAIVKIMLASIAA
ncbi:DsbA family protein [Pandoraea sp. NE5]|uniref:DsbA family oxidoreductase n=1 Tax=Pandoraea sp. NE5 TaxID=2904129 RepID=UPI0021C41D39|nr:DsbA family oxidoreductase [Pandoraea sp. NE5]